LKDDTCEDFGRGKEKKKTLGRKKGIRKGPGPEGRNKEIPIRRLPGGG